MKSTQAMRDRIRELSQGERDDYDRAVECVLDDLEALLASPSPAVAAEPVAARTLLDRPSRPGEKRAFGPDGKDAADQIRKLSRQAPHSSSETES